MAESKASNARRNVIAAGLGNALEWYDFGTYGFFAVIIGQNFFPSSDPLASLLQAFGVFAVGYMARPVGGIVLGNIGDRFGRRLALLLSIVVMGLATFAIGLLPTFEQIGVAAPILLILLRLVQGFAVAGEYSSSTIYLIEQAPAHRRGYHSSWTMAGSFAGILLGSAVGAIISSNLSDAQMQEWGWRLPFLFSALIAAFGYLLRRHMQDNTEEITGSEAETNYPALQAIRQEWRAILAYFSLILVSGIGFYLAYVYAVSDLTEHMHVSSAKALDINSLALFVIVVICPIAGLLSDRIGRKPLALFTSIGMIVGAWPLWWLIHHESSALILLGQLGFALIMTAGWTVYALWIAEILPLRTRCSVIGIGNGLAYGIFGGLTPLAATYLVARTGDDFAPAYLLIVVAAVSLVACLRLPETAGPKKKRVNIVLE